MTDTLTVASKTHMAIQIVEPNPNPDKPGEAPALKSAVLNGANHPDAKAGVGITHGVDAGLFHGWLDQQKKLGTPLADMVSEVSAEDAEKPQPVSFGHEPGLKALAEDSENTKLTEQGSTVTSDGATTATDMAATSDTPNDDTPRGDPDVTPQARRQKPATAQVDPAQVQAVEKGTSPLPANPAAAS